MVNERLMLQIAVSLGSLVPISAGFAGAVQGSLFLADHAAPVLQDSHFRYLSGLLLAIGFGFASIVASIERKTARFQILTVIVIIGGLARLSGALLSGSLPASILFALAMELLVTPSLAIWQRSFSRKSL